MNSPIPKRIIQTGTQIELSVLEKACRANVRLMNLGFEYLYFDDNAVNDFVAREFPQYQDTFQSFRFPIQKYDFFRYLAVYHFGGFYFDLDLLLCEDLSDLLECSCVFAFEGITFNKYLRRKYGMDWELGNYAFGARPGHPFIRAIVNNCVRAQMEPEWSNLMVNSVPWLFRRNAYVLCSTGPGLVSRTYAENPDVRSDVKVLLPGNIYDRKTWHHFGRYGIHLMKSTWRKPRSKLYIYIWNYIMVPKK